MSKRLMLTASVVAALALSAPLGSVAFGSTARSVRHVTVRTVTVSATPSAIGANGSKALIEMTVQNGNHRGIARALVRLRLSGGASCGTLSSSVGRTNKHGKFHAMYLSSTTSGFCHVVALNRRFTGTTEVVQENAALVGQGTHLVVTESSPVPASVVANGSSTATFQVTVKNGLLPVSSDPIEVVGVPSLAGACGAFSPTDTTTGVLGSATITYTSSRVAGKCVFTAREAYTDQVSTTQTISQS